MTAADKAQSLFDKMNGFRITHAHRIKCAKVVCDELMVNAGWERQRFLLDTKIELDKLKKK